MTFADLVANVRRYDPSLDPAWLDGIDGVSHLAGLSNDPTAEYNPAANWERFDPGWWRYCMAVSQIMGNCGIGRENSAPPTTNIHFATGRFHWLHSHAKRGKMKIAP